MFTETSNDTAISESTFTGGSPAPAKRQLSLAQRLALGSRLTELREAKGLSQLQVAQQALGFTVSHAAVSRLERGVFGVVEDAKLDKLAAFYGTSVESLLFEMEGRSEDDEPEEYRASENLTVQPGVEARLFNLRQAMGLTKMEMANHLGHEMVTTWHTWETGKATPRPDTLLEIAAACNVSASWLITGRRAKPQAPVFSMRLRAMQKLYGLDNREMALLANMDVQYGRSTIARLSRGRARPTYEHVQAIACALDVPAEWICPPEVGYSAPELNTVAAPATGVEKRKTASEQFLDDLRELFESSILSEEDVRKLRNNFMKELVQAQRRADTEGRRPGARRKD